jgi:hypothetical protein
MWFRPFTSSRKTAENPVLGWSARLRPTWPPAFPLSRAGPRLCGVLHKILDHCDESTSVHHKFRVRLSPAQAGVDVSPEAFRDAIAQALRAEGAHVVAWQSDVLPAQPIFRERTGYGDGWPWSTDRETDFAALYDPRRFRRARALLECSLVLFSQSCPLIAQSEDTVDRYAEAFRRVWGVRGDVTARAAPKNVSCQA